MSSLFIKRMLSVSIAMACSQPLLANDLEQVIVVANKVERPINEIAAHVTVIDRTDIENTLSTSISDVFQYTPGIDTESAGTRFGTEGINIRGIGGNRVAILIDGVPLSDQFDIGSYSNATRDFLNAGFIQRTEILHGSASALYGSDAIGGVVATYTPDPTDIIRSGRSGAEVSTTYRDIDQSTHLQAMFATGDSSLGFIGAASWRDGQEAEPYEHVDKPDSKDYERRSLLLKVVAENQLGHSWRASYIHQGSESESDQRSMLGNGRFRSTTKLLGDDDYKMDMLTLQYGIKPANAWIDSAVVRAYYQDAEVTQNTIDERALAKKPATIDRMFSYDQRIQGLELNLQKEFSNNLGTHTLGFGLEYQDRRTKELRDGLSTSLITGASTQFILGESFPLRDFPISDTEEWGAYFEYGLSAGNWTTIASIRADKYDLKANADSIYIEDNPDADVVSLSESDISPKLGIIYHLSDASEVYLQYSHGFRAPPFEDANIGLDIPLFNIRAIPNPDLKSESSDGFDLGYRWRSARSDFHISLFNTNYDDFIETKVKLGFDPISGRVLFQSQNLSEAKIKGLEAGWRTKLTGRLANFDLNTSLYIAEGKNKENHQALNSVGPDQLTFGLGWTAPSGIRAVNLRGTFTDKWDDRDESGGETFKPNSYALLDLFYMQKLTENTTLRASLHNLTDKKYWGWSDVRNIEPDDPMLPVLARPGRSASLSFNMTF